MKIYTDGSAHPNPGPGGLGIVFFDDNNNYIKSFAIESKHTTNNEMEMKAILYALKLEGIEDKGDFLQPPIVYTDSAYAFNTFTNWMYNWERNGWLKSNNNPPENLEIVKEFFELSKIKKIDLRKIPGHSGILGNELADQLATGKICPQELSKRYRK